MAGLFLAESSYRTQVTANEAQLERLVDWLLVNGLVLVVDQDDVLVGMLGLAIVPSQISGDLVASEVAWWIHPEFRGTRAAVALLASGEAWAQAQGAQWVQLIAPAGSSVGRLYRRRGYDELETTWQMRIGA
jgi:GNAT superfamily N-acetyltransferase